MYVKLLIRVLRIAATNRPPDNQGMDYEKLFERAVRLAYEAMDAPSDGRILAIFAQLVCENNAPTLQ